MTGTILRAPVLAARDAAGAPPGVSAPLLQHLSLELAAGSWLGITGPNGAGKSTLALTLGGLWPARSGAIERGAGHEGRTEARVLVILQEPATQLTQRSVREEIAFTALNLGLPLAAATAAALHWAERFGLTDALERVPHELSAGQQQRVLLAAALAASPDLLIADEGAAHLDAEGRSLTLAILKEQVAAGLAVLWITQEPAELAWADRVLTLGTDGTLSESSVASEVVRRVPRESAVVRDAGPAVLRVNVAGFVAESFRVRRREPIEVAIGRSGIWAVLGPNGSGKTSLLEAIAGIGSLPEVSLEWACAPDPGPMLAGQYPERQIFEERVKAEVLFAAVHRGRPAGEAEADALALARQVGLDGAFLERRTWSLSAGEKRLVSLIGALIAPSPLLLLDEPTCGLDPERRRMVAQWVREVSHRIPVIVASQDRGWIDDVGAIEVSLGLTVT